MNFTDTKQVDDFLRAVNSCKGEVWLESPYGDKFNLKSSMSTYVAMSKMIRNESNNLELFCSDREDEAFLLKFMSDNPEVI